MAFTYTPKARVQRPAPHFSGTAVVDGTFEGERVRDSLSRERPHPFHITSSALHLHHYRPRTTLH